MGKKKSFIDKKRSTTYSLVYRNVEDPDEAEAGPGRTLLASGEMGAPVGGAGPPSDPRALYRHFFGGDDDDEEQAPLSEERRLELLEFGFPDDGYDYLKHCRVLGAGRAGLEGMPPQQAAGAGASTSGGASGGASSSAVAPAALEASQSVYLQAPRKRAPAADVKVVDVRHTELRVAAATAAAAGGSEDMDAEAAAAGAGATVPAAAGRQLGGRLAAELAELEAAMAEAEGLEEAAEPEEELGAFLDEFVASAAQVGVVFMGGGMCMCVFGLGVLAG